MYIPALWTVSEYLLVEVELIVAVVLVQTIEVLDVAGVAVWICECELDAVLLIAERELEHALQFAGFTQDQWAFGGNAGPVGPISVLSFLQCAFAVDRPIALGMLILRERAVHKQP